MRTSSEKQQVQEPVGIPATVPYDEKAPTVIDDSRNTSRDKLDKLDKIDVLAEEEGSQGSGEDAKVVQIPWKYRLTAIVLIILFGTGNTYANFVMGPLKTRLVRELEITSKCLGAACWSEPYSHDPDAQYSVITSAGSLINTLLPIIGGSVIDRYGGSR